MGPLERLIGSLRRCCQTFPDKRRGMNGRYSMGDIGLAAFSVFFMGSSSFLAHQRRLEEGHGRSNCESLFDLSKIPSDNHIRAMLDEANPSLLEPVFADVRTELERVDGLAPFKRLGGTHVLIALDGSEYFCSQNIHCPQCSRRARANGKTEYFHAMLGATLVAPGHQQVVPLPPEFIAPQDGADKQDCENRAAHRWIEKHAAKYANLNPVYLGDDLFSHQPLCQDVLTQGAHFIFVCKPSSHPLIAEYIKGAELESLVLPIKHGRQKLTHRYRWLSAVPLRDGKDALLVNWFEIEIVNPAGKVTYRNSFVTDLPISHHTVAELCACGRARWKIENETFNVLKTKGYNLEHNFGHGKKNLSALLVSLNLLAFAFHTVCDVGETFWRQARQKVSSRAQFFHNLAAITTFHIFPSWDDLLQTLAFAKPPPLPP
jgi:hypothetical protein